MVEKQDRQRDRRADILLAAESEFAAAGWAGARVERIAATARVNKQLLFHYFGSKDGLFRAALGAMLSRVLPVMPPVDSPAEEVRLVLGRVQQAIRERPGLVAVLATAASDRSIPPDARTRIAEFRSQLVARVHSTLQDGQRRGYFRDDIDPAEIAALGVAAALGGGALDDTLAAAPVGRLITDVCTWR